jgi:sarcosine oxidase, subunit gamma
MRNLSSARRAPLVATSPQFHPLPPATRHILRGGPAVRLAASRALGLEIPASACRALASGERAALWLGPDEWLLLNVGTAAEEAPPALAQALAELPHSLVDVSHRQVAIALSGPRAPLLLAAGCPLDLDPGAFPAGMCTRTMLAKTEIILWRTGTLAFRLEVWRSFAAYVAAFLVEAERGLD